MTWTLKTTHRLQSGATICGIRQLTASSLTEALRQAARFLAPDAGFTLHNLR